MKSYRVRLNPNNKQKSYFVKASNASRWAYNWTINKQIENYKNGGKFLSDGVIRKEITQLKKMEEYSWLTEVSVNAPKQSVKDACNAYKNFFKNRANFPKFKSRKSPKQGFYNDPFKIRFDSSHVFMEKIGRIRLSERGYIPYGEVKYYNPRIIFDGLHWYLSITVDNLYYDDNQLTNEAIGLDLGIKELATLSNGMVYSNINKTDNIRKIKKKIKRLQRKLSRKYLMNKNEDKFIKTENIKKLERKIRKQYKKASNIRQNYLHQVTTEIVKTKPSRIVIEDLKVTDMMKNKNLSKAVAEQGFYRFRQYLTYKCKIEGVELIVANQWFPSSKTCSNCKSINKNLRLSDREYRCPDCGFTIDRDLNASINLANYN